MITHPEKVLFPGDGITKGEVAAYYEVVAPFMVPLIRGRPVTMERFPAGIGQAGFMQKNVSKGFPAWLQRVETPKKDGGVSTDAGSKTDAAPAPVPTPVPTPQPSGLKIPSGLPTNLKLPPGMPTTLPSGLPLPK